MRRWSLFLVPAAFVGGIVAVSTGRWLVALLFYVVALASTLNVVATLDPEGKSPEVAEPWPPATVVVKPRRNLSRLASAGLVLKAGLVLSATAAAGAVTGSLPDTAQDWVAGAVDRVVGIDLPAGRPPGDRSGDSDRRVTQRQPEQGRGTPGPEQQPPGASGTNPANPASPEPSRTPGDGPGSELEGRNQPAGERPAPGEGETLPTLPISPPVPTTSAPPPPAPPPAPPPIDQPLPQVPRPMDVDPLSPRR